MDTTTKATAIKGGEFLIRVTEAADVFIPEQWNEEQLMIAQTCNDFLDKEVMPVLDRIDAQEKGLMVSLLDKAAELGLLGISIPEEYGGFGKDFVTSVLVTEVLGAGYSFAVAIAAHTGIGTLPIWYYGNDAQKKKYLPNLVSGAWKSSYCLTEPNAGSDANSGKTKAVLTPDKKHYLINGQKMWITNAGFAHVFIVFAKIAVETGDSDAARVAQLVPAAFSRRWPRRCRAAARRPQPLAPAPKQRGVAPRPPQDGNRRPAARDTVAEDQQSWAFTWSHLAIPTGAYRCGPTGDVFGGVLSRRKYRREGGPAPMYFPVVTS